MQFSQCWCCFFFFAFAFTYAKKHGTIVCQKVHIGPVPLTLAIQVFCGVTPLLLFGPYALLWEHRGGVVSKFYCCHCDCYFDLYCDCYFNKLLMLLEPIKFNMSIQNIICIYFTIIFGLTFRNPLGRRNNIIKQQINRISKQEIFF